MRPVFRAWIDWTWLFTPVFIERMTVISSAIDARPGISSLIGRPHLPAGLNFQGPLRTLADASAALSYTILPGYVLPSYFARAGLGSSRSTWLGPPCMNSEIIAFAFGAWCGRFGFRSKCWRSRSGLAGSARRRSRVG